METHTSEVATAVAAKAANVATYGGASTAIFFGLTANEFAAICGVVIGVIGLIANIYFKQKHLELAKKSFEEKD